MSEAEFWRSTPAKVAALVDAQTFLDRRRDYFIAELVSMKHNSLVKPEDSITPEDVLNWQYPPRKSVVTTFDDSMGASCDVEAMNAGLRAIDGRV